MRRLRIYLTTTLLVVATQAGTILVDTGGGQDLRLLAYGEATVDWGDADKQDDRLCTLAFAACELQRYLRALTGKQDGWHIADSRARPVGPTIRLVTQPDSKRLDPEGYTLRHSGTAENWTLTVTGGGRVGTLYGVYDLLHRLGVRWYAPGDANETVPAIDLTAPPAIDCAEAPAFKLRGFHAWEDRGDEEFLLWMARNRLNYWCVEQGNKPLVHKLGIQMIGGGHRITEWYLGPTKAYPYDHSLFNRDDEKPADPYPLSSEFQGDADGNGVLTYFEAHPEWYAWRDGKRSPKIQGDVGDNFCTSNPHAIAEWVNNAVTDLAQGRNRDATLMNAWMLDVGAWCECESCNQQGTPTDRNLRVVYEYAKGIKAAQTEGRINRPIRLLFLAYADVLEPPTKPLPPDFDYDMCIATYFPIVRCYAHTLDQQDCPRNARYVQHRNGWTVDPKRHYRGQLCIGEYYNVSGYKCLPICFMHSMAADIPTYYNLGARYFHYMHCTTRQWGNKSLTNWQMARQLWSPALDTSAMWRDYFSGRYGPAAATMRRFYEYLERMLCNVSELKYNLAGRLDKHSQVLYPGGHLVYARQTGERSDVPSLMDMRNAATTCRTLIDQTLSNPLPDRIRARVEEDERLFTYGEKTLEYFDLASRASFALRDGQIDEARASFVDIQRLADQLRADVTSTQFASSHANAANAFSATYATGVMKWLEEALGPLEPESIPVFNPEANSPLTLTGQDLRGGGAVRFSYGFATYPERIPISASGNYVYGQGTAPHDTMTSWFSLPPGYTGTLHLTVSGALTPIHGETTIPGTLSINGRIIFLGDMPFVEGSLQRWTTPAREAILRPGTNRIEIRNTHPHGKIGNRPWFGIDRLDLTNTPPAGVPIMPDVKGPADVALTYRSAVDNTEQPYRVYLPSAYDGAKALPLLVALHGTGGTQDTYFDSPEYANGSTKTEAEKRGVIVVCPHGRGTTEYRGIGENDVLTVIDEVIRQFAVDPDRIVCSGQSMGGTGTTYLCSRYPDLFAGGAPMASGYGHVNLLSNLRNVPMFYIQGANDWPIYAQEGPERITARLRELGSTCEYWVVPDQPHNTMAVSTERLLDWAIRQRRVQNPERITHSAYLPIHGRAYWLDILAPREVGRRFGVDAQRREGGVIDVTSHNLQACTIYPSLAGTAPGTRVCLVLDGQIVHDELWSPDMALACTWREGTWETSMVRRKPRPYTAHQTHPIGTVTTVPTEEGTAETSLGNWMADMMRHVTKADLAICNHRHYRGVRLRAGQSITLADLYDWLRPFARRLARFDVRGKDLQEIIEANISTDPNATEYLVQVSGCRYSFDRSRPAGQRLVESDIDPDRIYSVACEGQILTRETMFLAGHGGDIEWEDLDWTTISGAWRTILDCGGIVEGILDGRVRALAPAQ